MIFSIFISSLLLVGIEGQCTTPDVTNGVLVGFNGCASDTIVNVDGGGIISIDETAWNSLTADTVTKLTIQNNVGLKLSGAEFGSNILNSLTQLVLDGNSIDHLPSQIFDSLTNLESLKINNNANLKYLPANVFDELVALTDLDLEGCSIESVPPLLFKNNIGASINLLDSNGGDYVLDCCRMQGVIPLWDTLVASNQQCLKGVDTFVLDSSKGPFSSVVSNSRFIEDTSDGTSYSLQEAKHECLADLKCSGVIGDPADLSTGWFLNSGTTSYNSGTNSLYHRNFGFLLNQNFDATGDCAVIHNQPNANAFDEWTLSNGGAVCNGDADTITGGDLPLGRFPFVPADGSLSQSVNIDLSGKTCWVKVRVGRLDAAVGNFSISLAQNNDDIIFNTGFIPTNFISANMWGYYTSETFDISSSDVPYTFQIDVVDATIHFDDPELYCEFENPYDTASCDGTCTTVASKQCSVSCDDADLEYSIDDYNCQVCASQSKCVTDADPAVCSDFAVAARVLSCDECNNSSYPDNLGYCTPCTEQTGCKAGESSATCSVNDSSYRVCNDCADDYINNDGICSNCTEQDNCQADSSTDSCADFIDSTVLGCTLCKIGFYPNLEGNCTECIKQDGCEAGQSSTSCSEVDQSVLTCNECIDTHQITNGICSSCSEQVNCESGQSTASCSTSAINSTVLACSLCKPAFYSDTDGYCTACTDQINCDAGGSSLICSNSSIDNTVYGCTNCKTSFYSDSDDYCLACASQDGCQTDTVPPICSTHPVDPPVLHCDVCKVGYHSDPTVGFCTACTAQDKCLDNPVLPSCSNSVIDNTVLKCDLCDDGFYSDDNQYCTACTDQEDCEIAQSELTCATGENKDVYRCSQCKEGFQADADGVCSACTDQTGCVTSNAACLDGDFKLSCDTCDSAYHTLNTPDVCEACTNQTGCYNSSDTCLTGLDKLSCDSCEADYHSLTPNVCEKCDTPSNCTQVDASCVTNASILMCIECAEGLYSDTNGVCQSCTIQDGCTTPSASCLPGQSELACDVCEPNYHTPEAKPSVCELCTPQAHCTDGSTNSTICVAGTGFLKCDECLRSYDFDNGICAACVAQTVCEDPEDDPTAECLENGSRILSCKQCPDTITNNDGICGDCINQVQCRTGHSNSSNCLTNSQDEKFESCSLCNNGFFTNQGFCEACSEQTGCVISDNTQCVPNNTQAVCSVCDDQYYNDAGRCVGCNAQVQCEDGQSNSESCVANEQVLQCNECKDGFFALPSGHCSTCQDPEILTLGNCAAAASCSGDDGKMDIVCSVCVKNHYLDEDDNVCIACVNQTSCITSRDECVTNSKELQCENCTAILYSNDEGICDSCNQIPTDCASIGTECVNNTATRECFLCNDGFTLDEKRCNEFDCSSLDISENCTESYENTCIPGKELRRCSVCKEGHYLVVATGECNERCDITPSNCDTIVKECFDNTTTRQCSFCSEGYYSSPAGECLSQNKTKCAENSEELNCDTLLKVEDDFKCANNKNVAGCAVCKKGFYLDEDHLCVGFCNTAQPFCTKLSSNETDCIDGSTKRACQECSGDHYALNGVCVRQECINKNQTGCMINDYNSTCLYNTNFQKCVGADKGFFLNLESGEVQECANATDCALDTTECLILPDGTESEVRECLECNPNFELANGTCVVSPVDEGSKSLSKAAIAGIVVACILVLLLLIAAALFYRRRVRKKMDKLENKGLGGLTPEQFVLKEMEAEKGSNANFLQTDEEYQQNMTREDSGADLLGSSFSNVEKGEVTYPDNEYSSANADNTEYSSPATLEDDKEGACDYTDPNNEYMTANNEYADAGQDNREYQAPIPEGPISHAPDDGYLNPAEANVAAASPPLQVNADEEAIAKETEEMKNELEETKRILEEMQRENELLQANLHMHVIYVCTHISFSPPLLSY